MLKAIRIDLIDEEKNIEGMNAFIKVFEDVIEQAFIVKEIAKKTRKKHLQGIIKTAEGVKDKDMRNFIKRKILHNQGEKGDYAFPPVKHYDKYMVYLSKGVEGWCDLEGFNEGEAPEVFYTKGYTEETLAHYRQCALEIQENYIKTKQEKKQRKSNLGEDLWEYVKAHEGDFIKEATLSDEAVVKGVVLGGNKMLIKKALLDTITNFFGGKDHQRWILKPFTSRLLEGYYNAVEYQYIPKTTRSRMYNDLYERCGLDTCKIFTYDQEEFLS